ncbi:MAG: leucyl/phenylalanyl-tRNA--protein transferase [Polyangiaceae bacterium]|nr:leucyl/phenylalanyl-tRNA--protein transferase [Polyangiaceae bacterium]
MPSEPAPSRFVFPDPRTGDGEAGVVGFGADFEPGTLLAAYRAGIFPWPNSRSVPWCSPDPRGVLSLDARPEWSRSVRRARQRGFRITVDAAFDAVVERCAALREGHTWIRPELARGFAQLHELGWAHSVEVWRDDALVGGLYGLAIGASFAGESMFHTETDASKVAFSHLADGLFEAGFHYVDAQLPTPHLETLGVRAVPRDEFLPRLAIAVAVDVEFPRAL